ncbi:hypothetical protein FKB34_14540 [Glycocaulis profundi]|nr:hypothetical protein FKB34_14540 [Glycocaulis profundi]
MRQGGGDKVPLPLFKPALWPDKLSDFLLDHCELFADWSAVPNIFSATSYDRAIYQLVELLQPYSLRAWHCTRLTDREIKAILSDGMQPPNERILHSRIDALQSEGVISGEVAALLKARNQANEEYRRGRIHWCFYPPRDSGESGIASLLGTWGGEALYNSHDFDPVIGPLLRSIGTPCIVEADIPIALLGANSGAVFSVVANFLADYGYLAQDYLRFEDSISSELDVCFVRRVVCHPDPEFITLSACDTWYRPIGSAPR